MTVDYELSGTVFLETPIDLGGLAPAPWPYEVYHSEHGSHMLCERMYQPGQHGAGVCLGEFKRNGVLLYLGYWQTRRKELLAAVATVTGKKIDPAEFRIDTLNVVHFAQELQGPAPRPDRLASRLRGFVHDPDILFVTCLKAPNASVTVCSLGHFWVSPARPRGPIEQAIEYWVRESKALREKVASVLREIAAGN